MSPGPYGPDAFMDQDPQNLFLQTNAIIPGSDGGPIESVKEAVTDALTQAIHRSAPQILGGRETCVYLEYPLVEEQYPGIWLQFSIGSFLPLGMGHEIMTQTEVDGELEWTPISAFQFEGRVSMQIVAMTYLDRDRISQAIMLMVAFSRTPEVWVTKPEKDTKQFRTLMTAFNENPYVSVTPNLASVTSGGQGADYGAPWQEDVMVYTDSWSFDLVGQTQIKFLHDGAFSLSRIDFAPTLADRPPDPLAPAPSPIGRGDTLPTWRTL